MHRKLLIVNKLFLALVVIAMTLNLLGCTANSTPASSPATATRSGWTSFTDGNQINNILITGNTLWAATMGGVVRWNIQNGTYKKYTTADGLPDNHISTLIQDKQGNIWAGTVRGGICRFDGENWRGFTRTTGNFYDNTIISLACDKDDNILVGTFNGAVQSFDGKNWQQHRSSAAF